MISWEARVLFMALSYTSFMTAVVVGILFKPVIGV